MRTDQLAQPFLATEASWVMPLISTFVAAKTLDASQSHDDYMRMQFCNCKCYARKHIAGVSLIDATDAAQTLFIIQHAVLKGRKGTLAHISVSITEQY